MSVISVTIFADLLVSAATEIKETRWLWQRYKTRSSGCYVSPLGRVPLVVFSSGPTFSTSRVSFTC
ncbi:hypothetical protein GLYMA_19G100950v4 [Glycine max]|nr:hypothetical protein GLYMA_19G100950v4 [Glycine max]KAH1077162.1 hypothetical protein GYH30_052602 [Glycine max]KHN28567.1 hypothetical protein glysoja_021388 [Glycine soja]